MSKFFKDIKFIEHFKVYMIGEVASFPADEAEYLVNAGFAVFVVQQSGDADRLKKIMNPDQKSVPAAPETKHIPAAPQNKAVQKPEASTKSNASAGRKCGKCGKAGHTRANCPAK